MKWDLEHSRVLAVLHSHPDGWPLHPGTKAMTDRQTGRDEVTDQPAIPNTRLWMCDCHWTSALLLYWKPKGDYLISVSTSSTPPPLTNPNTHYSLLDVWRGGGPAVISNRPSSWPAVAIATQISRARINNQWSILLSATIDWDVLHLWGQWMNTHGVCTLTGGGVCMCVRACVCMC